MQAAFVPKLKIAACLINLFVGLAMVANLGGLSAGDSDFGECLGTEHCPLNGARGKLNEYPTCL